jgi:S-adenosylmethionine:tRNA ribosyltransferase-isomerase
VNKLSDYSFDLPPELIAQDPLPDPSGRRLLVLDRATGEIRHRHVRDLLELIPPEDVLVTNTDRVLPARIPGTGEGGEQVEVMVIQESHDGSWLASLTPELTVERVNIGEDSAVEIVETDDSFAVSVRFVGTLTAGAAIDKYGRMLLPPSVQLPSAPTDSRLSADMLMQFFTRRVRIAPIFCHIGPDTFTPVTSEDLGAHVMPAEAYHVDGRAAERINRAKQRQRRVWCVGTCTLRALESATDHNGSVRGGVGEALVFIRPPFKCRAADRLITDLHKPRSTPLMSACAFGGYERVMDAYREAVQQEYRFYNHGDAMAIV